MSIKARSVLSLLFCLFLLLNILPAAFAEDVPAEEAPSAYVGVRFLADDTQALRGLSVYDAEGALCSPAADAENGTPDYGSYQLAPGQYRFFFHDEAGNYEDLEDSFSVYGDLDTQLIPLSLIRLDSVFVDSFSYIDPIYADVITEEDLPEVPVSADEIRDELLLLTEGSSYGRRTGFLRESSQQYTDFEEAAVDLRTQLHDFEPSITLYMRLPIAPTDDQWRTYAAQLYSVAIRHTGESTEGDYFHYEVGGYKATGGYSGTPNAQNLYLYKFIYSPLYYANAEQEAELTPIVDSILASLALDGKSDYEKICAIYDYLCEHVKYDHSTDKTYWLKYTAYAALKNNLAVCQGYSAAFYRLCLESGIDARVVTSKSITHAWNIVRFGGQYYELDATWDRWESTKGSYRHFLKGSTSWNSSVHRTIGDEFYDGRFDTSVYIVPSYDFAAVQNLVAYDASGLQSNILGLEDLIASMAKTQGSEALGLSSIRAGVLDEQIQGSASGTIAYEIFPAVTAYNGESVAEQHLLEPGELEDEAVFTLALPVPADWAGRNVRYTLSSSGYADVSGTAEVTRNESGAYGTVLPSVTHFGTSTLELLDYCTVKFNSSGGSSVTAQDIHYGDKAVTPGAPVKAGYWFGGWYTDSACTTAFDFANTSVTANQVLYAKWVTPDLVLPSALTAIDEEAFAGGVFSFVKLPEQLGTVGRNAFAQCPNLAYIFIPENVQIDDEAFGSLTGLTVFGKAGGTAAGFAAAHGFDFVAVS